MKKFELTIAIGCVGFLGFYVGAFAQECYRRKMDKKSAHDVVVVMDQVRINRPDIYEEVIKELEA